MDVMSGGETLSGSALVLLCYDVCEEIRLELVTQTLEAERRQPAFKHAAPEYVGFKKPPVVEPFAVADRMSAELKYYDYGVISVVMQQPFEGGWDDMVQLSARWMSGTTFEEQTKELIKAKIERVRHALVKPYASWLAEDYFVFVVNTTGAELMDAPDMVRNRGQRIAQIVRGETVALSLNEQNEVLQSSISYYTSDLAVVGWNAAFVLDTPAGAHAAVQLLEYANTQLLEFRHYDDQLTRELATAYRLLDHSGFLARWRLARGAAKLQAVTLDVTELTERVDNAIKFLSDMFSARLHSLAASKIGVADYKRLVEQKLGIARELYGFMVEQFHQERAFALEVMVVIILVIELVFLFRGH
jgi:hypothetical protein